MVSDFSLKMDLFLTRMKDIGRGKRGPLPHWRVKRVLERSGIFHWKRNQFLQEQREYAKLKITYFVSNEMCEHKKFTIIGWMSGLMNGDMYYRTRYGCNACGYEWMDDWSPT